MEDDNNSLQKFDGKGNKVIFEILMELPYWVNLRKGNYKFLHKNILKEKLAEIDIEIGDKEDYVDCILHVDNFIWRIGFDHFKEYVDIKAHSILISEDVEKYIIITDEELEEFFGDRKDNVFYQKLKTVVKKTYRIMLEFKNNIKKTEKEIVDKFAEPIKEDFLKSVNEFLEIYIGYFSSKTFCNEAYLLGSSAFSVDKVQVRIFLNDKDITHEVGFPRGFYSHPFYPSVFPNLEKEKDFFEVLRNNQHPSFTKILKGISNYFFLHGDIRIGILYLDMALESCINDFIKDYSKKNPEEKLRKIKKNHTIRDFLIKDLPKILKNLNVIENGKLIGDVIQFHNERNLIIHRKKGKIIVNKINQLRESTVKLIVELERYMGLPNIIEKQKTDFTKNSMGIAMETIPGGSWGKIKIFKSFSEMVQDINRRQGEKLKEDESSGN
ncbi:MAG: hypothetical protein ACFFG0_40575 [Candidatus Thorarchaeota archaeon]